MLLLLDGCDEDDEGADIAREAAGRLLAETLSLARNYLSGGKTK